MSTPFLRFVGNTSSWNRWSVDGVGAITWQPSSAWVEDIANDEGHEGWDATVAVGDDGVIHAAGVDPAQFGRTEGVEYYRSTGDGWDVTQIGSGPIPYQYNVALALDQSGSPSITYYNDTDQDLVFARLEGGSWSLERAAEEGDVGKYSSLAYDGEGRPAATFFRQSGSSEGEIVFASRGDGGWTSETIGQLTAFSESNARRNSSLGFDSQGRAHVAFSDTQGVWYAIRGESGWEIQQIVEADLPLGQLVSMVIDGDDRPHIAIYEVTRRSLSMASWRISQPNRREKARCEGPVPWSIPCLELPSATLL